MSKEIERPATPLSLIAVSMDRAFEVLTGVNPGAFCNGCETEHRTHDYVEVNGGKKVFCSEALKDAKHHGVVAKCEWCDKLWETEEMSANGNEYDGETLCPECR